MFINDFSQGFYVLLKSIMSFLANIKNRASFSLYFVLGLTTTDFISRIWWSNQISYTNMFGFKSAEH